MSALLAARTLDRRSSCRRLAQEPIEPALDFAAVVLRVLSETESRQVYRDVIHSLLQVNPPRDAFSAILRTLARFAELGRHTKLPVDLVQGDEIEKS